MSLGADLENTSLAWLDRVTETSNGTVERNSRVLASSAERLVQELSGVYEKIQTRDRGQAEAQQLNSRLQNLGDLLDPAARKVLQDRMATDLSRAQKMGGESATDLSKLLGDSSDNLKRNSKPNTAAIDNAGKRLGDFWAKENTLFRDRVTALTQVAAAEGKSWRLLSNQVRELLILERRAGTESARSTAVNAKLGITGRAELIARTEMQTAYIQGQLGKFRDMGYDWARWSATAERSCPYCIARDGLVYQLQEVESAIPAHPRCRCSLIPADAPANWGKGNNGVEAAESLDDAYWARSRSQKVADFRKNNPRFTDAELIRYVNTPTNSQAYLRPGQPAAKPVWSPSGSLIPNLEQVVLNAAAAARNMQAREQRAEAAEAERLEQERERLEAEAAETERLSEVERLRQQQATEGEALRRAREELDLANQELARLESKREQADAKLQAAREQQARAEKRTADLEAKLKRAQDGRDALLKKLGNERDVAADIRRYVDKQIAEAETLRQRISQLDADLADSGPSGQELKRYNRELAEATHSLDSLKQLGKDVIKAAGVANVREIVEWTRDARLVRRDSAERDVQDARRELKNLRDIVESDLKRFDTLEQRIIEGKRNDWEDRAARTRIERAEVSDAWQVSVDRAEATLREAQAKLDRVSRSLIEDPPRQGATDPAQAVIDLLKSTSPITKEQADKLVKQAATPAARKNTGLSKPKADLLTHVADAVQLFGGRLTMDAYGLAQPDEMGFYRAHAMRRAKNTETGEWMPDIRKGYVHMGDVADLGFRQTQFHELGHHVEYVSADVYAAAQEFIQKRAKGRQSESLREITKNPNYREDEFAYPGEAINPYVLKDYRRKVRTVAPELADKLDNTNTWADYVATEVVSMGVEHLSGRRKVRSLGEQDAEHLLLSLGVARLTQARASQVKSAKGEFYTFGPERLGNPIEGDGLPTLRSKGLTDARRAELEAEAANSRKRLEDIERDLPEELREVKKAEAELVELEGRARQSEAELAELQRQRDAADAEVRTLTRERQQQEQALAEIDPALREQLATVKRLRQRVEAASESTRMEDRVGRMAAADIEADPTRFQYKLNANKDTGEVGSLRGVETWNEDLAGVLSVWKDPANGQTYVINGHNRLALAKRLGVTDMPVLYVQAKTAAEARAIGAKQNIANGDGTAIDAAKFMRDTGQRAQDMLAQGLNLKGKVARDGAALAELPDFMFNAVAEGRLSVEHGSAIGRSGLSQGQMADAYKVLQGRPSMSPATLDEVLLAARASRSRVREETTLFGTDKVETSTMIERAELAAKVRAEQAREVRTLDKAAGKADVLATRGNRIDVQQAQVRAAEAQARADVFDLLKNRPTSKVAKALNDAAAKIQDAPNRTAKGKATSESRALVDAAIDAEIAQMAGSGKGLLRSIADLKAKRAGEFANPPELELAVAPADLTLERVPARLINLETAKAGTIGSVRPDQIKADAKRFQYKAATDAQTGEVGSLEGVRRFDPALAGVISVWKDPSDGVTYVINGHNRLAAARRLGADAVSVRYISASNPAEARAIGALANIAEGQGTAIDAAKFMREMGYGAEDMKAMGVPLKKSAARDGANLASLPDPLWELVVQERLSVDKASEIGGSGLDAEGMAKVADTLSKRPNASLGAVRELVAAEKASMEQGTTLSLFNDPTDATYQLDRAQLTRGVRDELLGDKRLFGTLATSRAAQTLEGAGSTLDTDANRQASAEADRVLAVFDQLKNVSGPVSEALNSGARQLAEAKTASDRLKIQRQIRLEVVEAVDLELRGVPDAPEPPPEAPGQVGLFG